jgi:hypothetical protein
MYTMQEAISFSFSGKTTIKGAVAVTIPLLLWLCLFAFFLYNEMLVGIIAGACLSVLFFLIWLKMCNLLIKYLKGMPALQLTPQALIDNMNNLSFAWKDIRAFNEDIYTMRIGSSKGSTSHLVIYVYNEDYYLSQLSEWDRLIARLNRRSFLGAFTIGLKAIKEDSSAVLEALNDFKYRYS